MPCKVFLTKKNLYGKKNYLYAMEKEKKNRSTVSLNDIERELGTAFAERLRKTREEQNLSQQALATGAGVSVTTIQNYEKGQYPKSEHAISLSRFLCCSLDWLLTGREDGYKGRASHYLDESRAIDDKINKIQNKYYKHGYEYTSNVENAIESYNHVYAYASEAEKSIENLKKTSSLLYYEILKFEVMSSLSASKFNYKYTYDLYNELCSLEFAKNEGALISTLGSIIESRKQ